MSYPKHVERVELELKSLDRDIELARKKMDHAIKVLGKHKSADEKKKGDYEDYLALILSDPVAAEELNAKRKLKATRDRMENKKKEISNIRASLEKLLAEREILTKDKVVFANYDPLQEHRKDPAIAEKMKEFKFSKERPRSNSKFSTLQALFARPEHRMVPKPGGQFELALPDQLPLEAVVMDPDLIPDWLLEEFGFAQIPADATPLAKLQAKVEAMPKVRALFKNAAPLENQHDGAEQKWLNHRLLAVQGMGAEHDGKILYTRYQGRSEEKNDRKILQIFHSAYDTHRKTEHADKRYEDETRKILLAEFRINDIHEELYKIRKGDPDAAAKKEGIRVRLVEEVKLLSHATNVHKRSAFDSLLASVNLEDSKDRENLGAACARLLKARGQIRNRRPQIFKRSQFGQADQSTLDVTIGKGETYLSEYRNATKEMGQKMAKACMKGNPIFNGSEKGVGNQAVHVSQALLGRLKSMVAQAEMPPVRPFNLYSQKLQAKLESIQHSIGLGKNGTTDKYALTALEVSKAAHLMQLFDFQKLIERLIKEVSLSQTLNLPSLTAKAVQLESAASSPDMPVSATSAPYQAAFSTVLKMSQGLIRGLSHYSRLKMTDEDTLRLRHSLKAYLETVDFPAIVATLD